MILNYPTSLFQLKAIANGEEYGFFFFKKDVATEGNVMYTLTKATDDFDAEVFDRFGIESY